jgi:hypothetical protein
VFTPLERNRILTIEAIAWAHRKSEVFPKFPAFELPAAPPRVSSSKKGSVPRPPSIAHQRAIAAWDKLRAEAERAGDPLNNPLPGTWADLIAALKSIDSYLSRITSQETFEGFLKPGVNFGVGRRKPDPQRYRALADAVKRGETGGKRETGRQREKSPRT